MAKGRGPSRISQAIRSLLVMGGIGGFLIVYNLFSNQRDVGLAEGPEGASQERFFVDSADRPDIKIFYRKLTDPEKLTMARNIGRYQDPQLAKLCGILLGDFNPEARAALTDALTHIGQAHPDAVANQLDRTGSFEQFGIRQALLRIGDAAVPMVVQELYKDTFRDNAEAVLVAEGEKVAPALLPLLADPDPKARVAAVDVLGKLRVARAVGPITQLYGQATEKDRQPYLVALASIADPSSESLLSGALKDEMARDSLRTQAALGLGRIASPTAINDLWRFAKSTDSVIRDGCLSALLVGKDKSLVRDGESETDLLTVAAGVESPKSNDVIRADLTNPTLKIQAAQAASGRKDLVPDLARFLSLPANQSDGLVADRAIQSLQTTDPGRQALTKLSKNPLLAGLIKRRELMRIG